VGRTLHSLLPSQLEVVHRLLRIAAAAVMMG
jgi:hypothetical protein